MAAMGDFASIRAGAWAAAILAIGSSLDNLMVGLALGMGKKGLPGFSNLVISGANAAGMLVAALAGGALGSTAPGFAGAASSSLFMVLGLLELRAWAYSQLDSPLADAAMERPWVVAVPMSLNNLASGLAGGLAGIHPLFLFIAAFAASWVFMAGGHYVGVRAGVLPVDPRFVGGSLFVYLAVQQMMDLPV